jgi:hypothetical protein
MSIYVEILIRVPMEELWAHTQTPQLHERWDLRFSRIEYLPKGSLAEPQRFRYTTRIGFGLQIAGEGESVGERDSQNNSRTSALKFSSSDSRSIIREGSGYWKYIPTEEGIRFLTWYDYRTRFGSAGAVFDRLVFRPLMGWATAWSFDRLRLWLEHGIEPGQSMRQSLIHGFARISLAAIFAYHGLVPKLLGPHADEVTMMHDAGVALQDTGGALAALGVLELLFSASLLTFWRHRWPPAFCFGLMLLATLAVAVNSPRYFAGAFNPFTLNLAIGCIAVIDLIALKGLPTAANCRRQPIPES